MWTDRIILLDSEVHLHTLYLEALVVLLSLLLLPIPLPLPLLSQLLLVLLPTCKEAGFLNLGKIELGGGFAINLDYY